MFLEEERRVAGDVARGGAASWTDVAEAARRDQWYRSNVNAQAVALEEAYDKTIGTVYAATGVRLVHPMRRGSLGDIETGGAAGGEVRDHFADFDAELAGLAKQHPDKVERLRLDVSPQVSAAEMAREAKDDLASVDARYRGPMGTGTLAQFWGGFKGMLRDPANTLSMMVGATGRAGAGLKGLVWMATKEAAVNATVETAFQPAVAAWHKKAGIEYGAGDFAANVGSAAAFGFGMSAVPRGLYRGAQKVAGRVPILDEAGGVRGYESPEAALDRAALRDRMELYGRARDGDVGALRELAEKSGATDDPAVRSALDMLERIEDTSTRRDGVDPFASDEAEIQGLRHLADPAEPPPAPVRSAAEEAYVGDIARALEKGEPLPEPPKVEPKVDPGEPKPEPPPGVRVDDAAPDPAVEARRALETGEHDAIGSARLMRDFPEVAGRVRLATPLLRQAAALARLSDAAWEMVAAGAAEPRLAAFVGHLVPDRARHASILDELVRLQPEGDKATRAAIGVLTAPGPPRVDGPKGLDDPAGPELDRQIEMLERSLGIAGRQARAAELAMPGPVALNAPLIRIGLKKSLGSLGTLRDRAVGMLTAYEREGLVGAANEIGRMSDGERGRLADKLAPGVALDRLGEEARARLLMGRVLRAASEAITSADADGGLPARLKAEAEALEGEAGGPAPALAARRAEIADGLTQAWSGNRALGERAADMLAAYEREGLVGAAEAIAAMGREGARDLAARVAGAELATFQAMPAAGKVLLLTGRLLRAAANVLDSAEPQSALAKALRQTGQELEAEARTAGEAKGEPVDAGAAGVVARGESMRAAGRTAETADDGGTRTARALRDLAEAFEDWRNFVPDYKRGELDRLEGEIARLKGGLGALDGEAARRMGVRVGELQAKQQAIEDRARADMAKRGAVPDAIRAQAAKAQPRGERLAGPALEHPDFPGLRLPLNADGGVTLWRGERPNQKTGKFTHRLFTTDFDRARDAAGHAGAIHVVHVGKGRLGEIVPRSSSADAAKVRPGQTVFTISEALAGEAERAAVPGSPEARALLESPEASLRAELDAADALERMRDVIEHCKD